VGNVLFDPPALGRIQKIAGQKSGVGTCGNETLLAREAVERYHPNEHAGMYEFRNCRILDKSWLSVGPDLS
jgi:hypothetical protein